MDKELKNSEEEIRKRYTESFVKYKFAVIEEYFSKGTSSLPGLQSAPLQSAWKGPHGIKGSKESPFDVHLDGQPPKAQRQGSGTAEAHKSGQTFR
jgi:hypothetical protein